MQLFDEFPLPRSFLHAMVKSPIARKLPVQYVQTSETKLKVGRKTAEMQNQHENEKGKKSLAH